MKKKFWTSKTFWVNLIAIAVLVLQSYTEFVISPVIQAEILVGINLLLRFVTKEPVTWK